MRFILLTNITNTTSCEMYIVLSQTGSFLSKILKVITKAKYNHSSISLTKDLTNMYSFGRLKVSNAFIGGFVRESIHEGMFKHFKNTDAAVFMINVPADTYDGIRKRLEQMYLDRDKYSYNTIGLITAFFGCHLKRKNKYYCSDFVYEVLSDFDIVSSSSFDKIVKPIDFYSYFQENLIYEGKFREYTQEDTRLLSVSQKRA